MPLERKPIAADAGFWSTAARAVCDFAQRCGRRQTEQQSLTWLVPQGSHAVLARAGLRGVLGAQAFIPPRIAPLADWLAQPLFSGTAARAELFAALRGNAWVRASFGEQPAALWSLARGVAQLADELSWAALGDEAGFGGRLEASLARHFFRRAARAMVPQAQLVLQLWLARSATDDAVTRAQRELKARAEAATNPLVYLASEELKPWEEQFLQHYARNAPVLLIEPDTALALGARPLLAAAWPEISGAVAQEPIAARADAIVAAQAAQSSGGASATATDRDAEVPLALVGAHSLEAEATAVAQQVLEWRRTGVASIALVALDRLTARRARALLERAQVHVRDETGWKLSTTSAAAAVMRWFDLVADDVYWRDLLDWLKSPFALADRADKAHEIAFIECAIRSAGTLQGVRAIRRAVAGVAAEPGRGRQAGAEEVLALIDTQLQETRRGGPTLAAHARGLAQALDVLGMRAALAADAVGAAVLRELAALEAEMAGVSARMSMAEFRALLAERFEEASFVDTTIESPVVMLSLAAAALRPFDAVLLIGADAQHLPAAPPELLFMSNAVRAELGLATTDSALREQARQLASLVVAVPRVVATWRTQHGDEPNSLSPLLERLQFVAKRASGRDLGRDPLRTPAPDSFAVTARQLDRPAPAAPQLLPPRLTASGAQSLVNCAYQFYARCLLKLQELDDVIEMPDKRDFGERLHEVLRNFHRAWGAIDFSARDATEVAASLREHAHAVFDQALERTPGLLAFRRRFEGLIPGYVDWLREQSEAGWRWSASEEPCAQPLALAGERVIELAGRIDRIDGMEADAGSLRVLDYKARAADPLKRGLKQPGEDIQLPFYGLLLVQRKQAAKATQADSTVATAPDSLSAIYLSFDRAQGEATGVEPVEPPQPFAPLVQAVALRLGTDLQRVADGAPLPAIGSDDVCRYCEMRGLCRRDYWQQAAAREGDAP